MTKLTVYQIAAISILSLSSCGLISSGFSGGHFKDATYSGSADLIFNNSDSSMQMVGICESCGIDFPYKVGDDGYIYVTHSFMGIDGEVEKFKIENPGTDHMKLKEMDTGDEYIWELYT